MAESFFLVVVGTVILVVGAYSLVEGASRIAALMGISELVVGLTVVAIGTSAPELAITVVSAFEARETGVGSELIIGNVVGSNIANIGLILGFGAFLSASAIKVAPEIIRRDFAWLAFATVLVGIFAFDSELVFHEGIILLAAMIAFSFFSYRVAMRQSSNRDKQASKSGRSKVPRYGVMVLFGIVGLALGSRWLVDGATEIALELNISEFIIGLTLVALGTSLPELATSIVGAIRGEGELIVGNVIGSNIYNLLLVLAAGMIITPLGIPDTVLQVQIPLMIGLTFALFPIMLSARKIQRWEGIALVSSYVVITVLAFVFTGEA